MGVKKRISELRPYGIQIEHFTFSQSAPDSFVIEAKKIIEIQPDGVVLAPFFKKESVHFIEQLKANEIPFVFIDSEVKNVGQLSYIGQDSYQSGFVSAKLLDLSLRSGNILVIHFAKEMDNQNHLVQREKGFYEWFQQSNNENHKIYTTEVSDTDTDLWMKKILDEISNKNIKGIFVTNSKVFYIGRLIEKYNLQNFKIIGHDLLKENIDFLRKGVVQFLICQRPEEQGYNAINKLFRHVVQKRNVSKENYTSIDIIIRENLDFYKEFK